MYDAESLKKLYNEAGFSNPRICEVHDSGIEDIETVELVESIERHIESVICEAIKE